jgi:hypothetical protein
VVRLYLFGAVLLRNTSIMSTTMLWSLRRTLVTVAVLMVAAFHVSAQADSPKKHRGPCEVRYPSDTMVEWDCRIIPPGGSLEAIFGEDWADVARFNRIDPLHALPKNASTSETPNERCNRFMALLSITRADEASEL